MEEQRRNEDAPQVTVMVDRPIEGFAAMVFLDGGMLVKTECKQSDAFDGYIKAVAALIVNMAKDMEPMPDINGMPTEENLVQLKKHMTALKFLQDRFSHYLAEQISIAAAAQQFIKDGLSESDAQNMVRLLAGIVKQKIADDAESAEPSDEDDSDE